jgi:hypothetical protein
VIWQWNVLEALSLLMDLIEISLMDLPVILAKLHDWYHDWGDHLDIEIAAEGMEHPSDLNS